MDQLSPPSNDRHELTPPTSRMLASKEKPPVPGHTILVHRSRFHQIPMSGDF
ncbi:MAG: hypothetical protein IPP25_15535 [Saprospiraceae bacterium]|nr:hypothetical protein [Candidatus Opimibacter skivensis]